jgi:hypothetical protein
MLFCRTCALTGLLFLSHLLLSNLDEIREKRGRVRQLVFLPFWYVKEIGYPDQNKLRDFSQSLQSNSGMANDL